MIYSVPHKTISVILDHCSETKDEYWCRFMFWWWNGVVLK